MRIKNRKALNKSLFSFKTYVLFFLATSFIVTCCMLLFLNNINFSLEEIRESAPVTFLNVIFLSLLFCILEGVRRKITIEKPIKEILYATEKITDGDFSVRVKMPNRLSGNSEFDIIAENFNIMAEEISGMEILRTDFISNVSHELKTPLAVINNYSGILQSTDISENERKEYAAKISAAANKLSVLITDILNLNKLENQQIFPDTQKYNLSEQICACLLGFENEWLKKDIDIQTDIDGDIYIDSQKELLSIVWNNLFSNALKFTENGGKVTVSLEADEEKCTVKVSDTGCGMNKKTGKHIFEKFYQGDTSHSSQGNGLGLALVKRIIDIVNGEISVESEIGTGSTFTVTVRRDTDEKVFE